MGLRSVFLCMSYYVYRHEGGLKKKEEGPFDDKDEAVERKTELNRKIDIALGGFKVHEEE